MQRFTDRVVWITGGGSGIGRAVALEFAREGASVAVSGRRMEKLSETVAAIETMGGRALAVPCDVMDEASIAAAVLCVAETWGRIDVAVANAGYSVMGRIEDLNLEYWQRQFDVNVFGLVATVRAALPELQKTQGRVVLLGSVAGFVPFPKGAVYAASKAAVRMIGETLSAELRGSGVSCTTVHPAYVESEILRVDNDGRLREDRKDPRPRRLVWKADKAAKAIVNASYHRRREVVLSAYGKIAVGINRLAPGLLSKMMGRGTGAKGRAASSAQVRRVEMVGEPKYITIDRSPGTAAIYLRSLLRMPGRPHQGVLTSECERTLKSIEASQFGVRINPSRLAQFREVCGSPNNGFVVPPAYLECLFLGPMAEIVLSKAFPFSPFGLIHTQQRITLLRPIDPDETLDLSCRLAEIRETIRGFEIDFALRVDTAGSEVWNGTTTVLSRNKQVRSGRGTGRTKTKPMPWIQNEEPFQSIRIHVPENTGRRYAAASGDWNPHHLYAATARLLGYRRPIAHGMWTFARVLAVIEADRPFTFPIEVNALFKRPIFMPTEIEIRLLDEQKPGGSTRSVRFEARDSRSGEPHMNGSMQG
ncbi:MAG: SDR family NAD(P)-dependent oxidoreductase [Deltaproteobacteria bacterium]|nr:SDR family NAD(P)-dependent oxidoreductase [Deltaproteobacteria bacterium]